MIWCAPERQADLHPVAISHDLGRGFTAEFDYSGTHDNSGWLAAPAALDYLADLGEEAIREHNAALAREACDLLTEAWGTEASAAVPFRAAMAAVKLPGNAPADRETAATLALRLTEEHRITAAVTVLDGTLWVRVSAQIYNEIGDYERLAAIGGSLAS